MGPCQVGGLLMPGRGAQSRKNLMKIVVTAVAVVLAIGVLVVNTQFEGWITRQYQEGNYWRLNQLAASAQVQSLDYYIGKIEDVTIGPARNFILHMALAALCLVYLPLLSFKRFCLVIFLFLAISKFNVLFYPPYGDAIGGPFIEGWWLAEHNFDYSGLFHQPAYNEGGPRVYMFSLYPTYIAILLKLIGHVKSFLVVNHLLVFFMAAVVVALLRQIMAKDHNDKVATLTALVLLALPIFQSQTEAINMEMPYLFFSMISVYFLTLKKMGKALLFTFLATFVKGHGILNCGLLLFFSLLFFFFGEGSFGKESDARLSRGKPRYLVYGFLAAMIALLKVGSKYALRDQHASAGMMKLGVGWASLKHMRHPYIYLATFVVFLGILLFRNRMRFKSLMQDLLGKYYVRFVMYLSAGMWYLLFLNFYAVSPRYMLGVTPFVIAGIVYVFLLAIPQLNRISVFVLLVILGLTALNAYGLSHRGQGTTYHVLSERSLQYRNDLKLNMKMARLIEKKYSHLTIGAPFITAQILRIPELGYVQEPLDVMAYGMPVTYAGIKRFEGLDKISIMNTLWIGIPEQFKVKGDFTYPVHEKDKIIQELVLGDNYAVLFMGGLSIDLAWRYLQYNQMRLKGGQ